MCSARQVPVAQTSRIDSDSPVLSVTNPCADQSRNRGSVAQPHPSQLPSPARPQRPQPPAYRSCSTKVARERGLGIGPDMVRGLLKLSALGDECNQTHMPAVHWEQQREHLVDAGAQHRPQVMRWALGRHLLCGPDLD